MSQGPGMDHEPPHVAPKERTPDRHAVTVKGGALTTAQRAAGNLAFQREAKSAAGGAAPKPGPATRAALGGADSGTPLPPATRRSLEGTFGANLGSVRLHTDAPAARAAEELDARAFTHGQSVYFGPNQLQPGTPEGRHLLAHEVAHTVQQSAGPSVPQAAPLADSPVSRHHDPLERQARDAADAVVQGRPAPPLGRTAASSGLLLRDPKAPPPAPSPTPPTPLPAADPAKGAGAYRPFPFETVAGEPDLLAVPADASREEVANRLYGDPAKTSAYRVVPTGVVPIVDYKPGKAVRVTEFGSLVTGAMDALRAALEPALDADIHWTISTLSQRFIGGEDERGLTERALRWSQRSDLKDSAGVQYFDAYLRRLKAIKLESFWSTRDALEWLLIEAEEQKEQIKKAIALRSSEFHVDYRVKDAAPELQKGNALGRFYSSNDVTIPIYVDRTIIKAATLEVAETVTRSFGTGLRAVVPGEDGQFYGYTLKAWQEWRLPKGGIEADPSGHFYWYHPGTIGIRPGESRRDFDPGGKQQHDLRVDLLNRFLTVADFAGGRALFGLDYDVLSVATVEQRLEIIKLALGSHDRAGIPVIARALRSGSEAEQQELQQLLADEGLTDRLTELQAPEIISVLGPRLTEEDEALMDRLESSAGSYKTYREYVKYVVPGSTKGGSYTYKRGTALDEELRAAGWGKGAYARFPSGALAEYGDSVKAFQAVFQRYAVQSAYQILDENEALVRAEYARYGGDPKGGGIAQLKASMGPLKEKVDALSAAWSVSSEKAQKSLKSMSSGGYAPALAKESNDAFNEVLKAEKAVKAQAAAMAVQFPVLADPHLDLSKVVYANDADLRALLQGTAGDRLEDIRKSREHLATKPEVVWHMEGAVERAKLMLNIDKGSVLGRLVRDKIQDLKEDHLFRSLLMGALALGLGVLTAGGGAVAVLAASGGAALSIYQVSEHVKEFAIKQAAAGTAFDRAMALSADDPSYFWLALDIVGAVLDVGLAVKALAVIKPAVKEVIAGTKSLEELKDVVRQTEGVGKAAETTGSATARTADEAKAAGSAVGAPAGTAHTTAGAGQTTATTTTHAAGGTAKATTTAHTAADTGQAAATTTKAAESAGKEARATGEGAKTADELAEKIAADTRRRMEGKKALEKLGADEANLLKTRVGGDEEAAAGLARMDAATRHHLLDALQDNPKALARLGKMAQESDEVATTVERLYKAFVAQGNRPDQLKAILEKFLLTRHKKTPNTLRAITEAGLDDADLAKIVDQMKGLKSVENVQREFVTHALTAIADKLPGGAEGIQKITEMTKWMEQSAATSVFERWASKHIYSQGMGRYSEEIANLPGAYSTTKRNVVTDNVLDNGPGLTAVETKNFTTPRRFTAGTEEGRQAVVYRQMIQNGVKGPGGKPFTAVEYLFSTKPAAEEAAPSIRTLLGNNATIYYVDEATGLKTAL